MFFCFLFSLKPNLRAQKKWRARILLTVPWARLNFMGAGVIVKKIIIIIYLSIKLLAFPPADFGDGMEVRSSTETHR